MFNIPMSTYENSLENGLKDYAVVIGSHAYGCNTALSDIDICGITIPPRKYIYATNYIQDYDIIPPICTVHKTNVEILASQLNWKPSTSLVEEPESQYRCDINIYTIMKYFKLLETCSPYIIETLYVDKDCIINMSNIGKIIRDNRSLFLSKRIYYTFKGFARSERNKKTIKSKYHTIRILQECKQFLTDEYADLRKYSDLYKQILTNSISENIIEDIKNQLFVDVDKAFEKTNLPNTSDHNQIRNLLKKIIRIAHDKN